MKDDGTFKLRIPNRKIYVIKKDTDKKMGRYLKDLRKNLVLEQIKVLDT